MGAFKFFFCDFLTRDDVFDRHEFLILPPPPKGEGKLNPIVALPKP
jgi:hypothetical protein